MWACACVCAFVMCTCLVIASFHYGSAGGGAMLQHCNEINDPWFFRCDQQTKLSSQSETKEVTGGKGKHNVWEMLKLHCKCTWGSCQCSPQWVSRQALDINTYSAPLYSPPFSTFCLKPSAKCCQTLTSVPKMNCIPEPSESRIHL